MNIEKALCVDNTPRYYITHESANESLVLTEKEFEDLRNQINLMLCKPASNKPKLIIHETDCHGCGTVYYNGKEEHYSYDDGSFGDVRTTVDALIDLGFINSEDVIVFDGSEDKSLYYYVEKGMNA